MRILACFASLAFIAGCPQSMSLPDSGGLDAPGGGVDAPGGADTPASTEDAPMATDDVPGTGDPDAPIFPIVDGGPGPDAPAMVGVMCGPMVCADTEICCVGFAGGAATMECTAPDACMGVSVTCDGPEDCSGGEVCCGMRGAGGGGSASCVPEADCGFGRLCHEDGDCSGMDLCCAIPGAPASVCSPRCFP